MAHGLMTWTADGKLQMTSERLTRQHSVYTIAMNYNTYPNHTQPVSGMINDGTWFALISVSPNNGNGSSMGNISDAKITINTGYFYLQWTKGTTDVIVEVLRI